MDIGSLNSAYADLYGTQQNQSTSKLENELNTDFTDKTDEELMDACKEFESYFLEMMFKEMLKTIPKSEGTTSYGSSLMDYYKDNMVQELAEQSTENTPNGLAQMLYEQMKRNYDL